MSAHEEGSAFDQWYNGLVGFHINSERILNDFNSNGAEIGHDKLEKWMKVCWNNALQAAEFKLNTLHETP
jgi:hypothetical protein